MSVHSAHIQQILDDAPPLPMSPDLWRTILRDLALPPQLARVAELILRNLSNKQIALVMNLEKATIETYLDRIYRRTHVPNRCGLILYITKIALQSASQTQ